MPTTRPGRQYLPVLQAYQEADGGSIDMWGDGSAIRAFTYVDDLVDGIYRLMHSDLEGAVNIGAEEYITVKYFVELVIKVSGKDISIKSIEGPVGVASRNFSKARIYSTGWEPKVLLEEGIGRTYKWISEQVAKAK